MAPRTNDGMVRAAFGGANGISPSTQTSFYIAAANSLTNKLQAADQAAYNQLDASDLQLIETLLACHYCASSPNEQQYANRTTEGASATFQGQTGMALKATKFGQDAMMLDVTNFLARHSKEVEEGYRQVASLVSLGEPAYDTDTSNLDVGPED